MAHLATYGSSAFLDSSPVITSPYILNSLKERRKGKAKSPELLSERKKEKAPQNLSAFRQLHDPTGVARSVAACAPCAMRGHCDACYVGCLFNDEAGKTGRSVLRLRGDVTVAGDVDPSVCQTASDRCSGQQVYNYSEEKQKEHIEIKK